MSENEVFYYFMEGVVISLCILFRPFCLFHIFAGIVSANTFSELFIDKCYKCFGAIVILNIPF